FSFITHLTKKWISPPSSNEKKETRRSFLVSSPRTFIDFITHRRHSHHSPPPPLTTHHHRCSQPPTALRFSLSNPALSPNPSLSSLPLFVTTTHRNHQRPPSLLTSPPPVTGRIAHLRGNSLGFSLCPLSITQSPSPSPLTHSRRVSNLAVASVNDAHNVLSV
ncbi:hypothetical protein PIB30_096171, partial [Stylosanthes scabra]|nr:hypothetical protein [Stylosanthes scabra]